MHKRILFALIFVMLISPWGQLRLPVVNAAALTFADRVACRQAIEQVYWDRRTWPAENEGVRPTLDELLPSDLLQQQIEDTLRQSSALAELWGETITPERLQAEINRMAANSQQPEALAELWQALDNDPLLIAECLARPQLVNRLITNQYATDDRLHGDLRAQATAELNQLASATQLVTLSGDYQEVTWVVDEDSLTESGSMAVDAAQFAERRAELTTYFDAANGHLPVQQVSALQEDSSRFYAVAVLESDPTHLRLGIISWAKQPLESWWTTVRDQFSADAAATSFAYALPILGQGNSNETWTPTQALPDPRYEHGAVWTGSEMVVWGGMSVVGRYFRDGGRYNPATDTWTLMSYTNAPEAGITPAVTWTGTEVLVWGTDAVGGRYNPLTNSWTAMTSVNAPEARSYFAHSWTGTELIVWGGVTPSATNSGGRYNPSTGTWTSLPTGGAPSPRGYLPGVWSGEEFIVWGGYTGSQLFNDGARYNPTTNSWTAIAPVNAPSERYFHTAVWTGTEMIVWGGSFLDNSGGRYNPVT
ncbi:MAG: hypothetical protein KC413_16455, partial [Anaerolineales bacterium]|nr:hypothetical protein [Anaerolineales bacterium]